MRDRFIDLIGPERFEFILAFVGIGLPVAIVLLMILVGTKWPLFMPWQSYEEDESEKTRRDADWSAATDEQSIPFSATDD